MNNQCIIVRNIDANLASYAIHAKWTYTNTKPYILQPSAGKISKKENSRPVFTIFVSEKFHGTFRIFATRFYVSWFSFKRPGSCEWGNYEGRSGFAGFFAPMRSFFFVPMPRAGALISPWRAPARIEWFRWSLPGVHTPSCVCVYVKSGEGSPLSTRMKRGWKPFRLCVGRGSIPRRTLSLVSRVTPREETTRRRCRGLTINGVARVENSQRALLVSPCKINEFNQRRGSDGLCLTRSLSRYVCRWHRATFRYPNKSV